jgi:hypothetical protein
VAGKGGQCSWIYSKVPRADGLGQVVVPW